MIYFAFYAREKERERESHSLWATLCMKVKNNMKYEIKGFIDGISCFSLLAMIKIESFGDYSIQFTRK